MKYLLSKFNIDELTKLVIMLAPQYKLSTKLWLEFGMLVLFWKFDVNIAYTRHNISQAINVVSINIHNPRK